MVRAVTPSSSSSILSPSKLLPSLCRNRGEDQEVTAELLALVGYCTTRGSYLLQVRMEEGGLDPPSSLLPPHLLLPPLHLRSQHLRNTTHRSLHPLRVPPPLPPQKSAAGAAATPPPSSPQKSLHPVVPKKVKTPYKPSAQLFWPSSHPLWEPDPAMTLHLTDPLSSNSSLTYPPNSS